MVERKEDLAETIRRLQESSQRLAEKTRKLEEEFGTGRGQQKREPVAPRLEDDRSAKETITIDPKLLDKLRKKDRLK